MIYGVRCSESSFKPVVFQPGFNIVLAERTQESTQKDSRNGLGKSTLIEIIHFCLGSKFEKGDVLARNQLKGWTFTLDLEIGGQQYAISRNTAEPRLIQVDGDTSTWPLPPDIDKKTKKVGWSLKKFNRMMGYLMFGLPITNPEGNYYPSFRSLISYFIRRGADAFSVPFEHTRKQATWDMQVHNAFLLGLGWEYAQKWQVLKDRERNLRLLTSLRQSGSDLLESLVGSIGELEANQFRLEQQSAREQEQLASFQVHPQYSIIREQANNLTTVIHQLTNLNVQDRKMLEMYQSDLSVEQTPTPDAVTSLYEEVGVSLPDSIVRRLEEVHEFHRRVVTNRREFLASEVQRLTREIVDRDREIRDYTNERASVMRILQTHGALEEYTQMADRHSRTIAQIDAVKSRIEALRRFEHEKSALKIELEQLTLDARADTEERKLERQRAISLFNSNSEALYEAPGSLIVDIDKTGFKFQVDIKRDGSDAIEKMKVFCYDLMLAQSWAQRGTGPGFLIHDSTIFADVDERQRALALELAAQSSEFYGFQYICCYNSDQLPINDFTEGFDINPYIRLILTDASESGGLLGIRF
jgi:uncharacterized protein YydD (DUF2326 family)